MTWLTLLCIAVADWVLMALIMAGAWGTAIKTGKSGWIDVFWTFGLGLVGILTSLTPVLFMHAERANPDLQQALSLEVLPRAALCATLIGLWSLRLGVHIARRTHGGGDDPRYAFLREQWGPRYRRQLFLFLQIQAFVGMPLLVSVLLAACRPAPFGGVCDIAAVCVFLVSILGEASADRSLRLFSKQAHRRDAVCDTGLWRLSRHPNYFFEWVGWCVWPVMGFLPVGFGRAPDAITVSSYPWAWLTLMAPLLMYYLLVHVSGIPPLEAHMARTRGQAWRDYVARTRAFFPWPKSGTSR